MGRGEVAEGGFTGTAAEPDELPVEVPGAAAEGAVGAGGVAGLGGAAGGAGLEGVGPAAVEAEGGLVADSSRALGESALTARWPFLSWSGAPSPEPAQQVPGLAAGELPGEVPAGEAEGAVKQGAPWPGPAGLGVVLALGPWWVVLALGPGSRESAPPRSRQGADSLARWPREG